MKQWERVEAMEEHCVQTREALRALESALNRTEAVLPRLQALDAYLGSPEWHQDRATDEAGGFPPRAAAGRADGGRHLRLADRIPAAVRPDAPPAGGNVTTEEVLLWI